MKKLGSGGAPPVPAAKKGGFNQQRSLSPPRRPSDISALKGSKGSDRKVPFAPAKQPMIGKKEPMIGKKDFLQLSSSDDSAIYIRGGGIFDNEKFDPKMPKIIPKILLESGAPRKGDDFAKVVNTPAYEMFDKLEPASRKSSIRGISKASSGSRSRPSTSRRRSVGRGGRGGRGRRGQNSEASQRSAASVRSQGDNAEKKKQKKFIRALPRDDEYGEPNCCPRTGILSMIWLAVIVIVALVLVYAFEVDFQDATFESLDNHSCFYKIFLTEDTGDVTHG